MPRSTVIGAALTSLWLMGGCVQSEPLAAEKREVLAAIAQQVVQPTLDQFEKDAAALALAAQAWAEQATHGPAPAELQAARAAFATALVTWERAEVLQFGPAGQTGRVTEGASARDPIYAWPSLNPCQVDSRLVDRDYSADSLRSGLVTIKGLAAVERLLWSTDQNGCPPEAPINAMGTWAAMTETDRASARAQYAVTATALVSEHAAQLAAKWRDAFAEKLAQAGTPGNPFPTAHAALNEVFAGLFYLDGVAKDKKLGAPSGLTPDCTAASCPALVEAPASGLSQRALLENLDAARALLGGGFGSEGAGFDRLVKLRGAPQLGTDLFAKLAAARASVAALDGPIDAAVVSKLDAVHTAYFDLKAFTDLMKSQLVTTLALKLPEQGAGDND